MKAAQLLDLGTIPYREAWELQHALHAAVQEEREPETWLFVEHPPVITLGRNAKPENLLLSAEVLAARGVDIVQIERGGDVTYHGPGQLVVYPIRKLERFREVVPLVRALEETVIRCCATFDVTSERWSEHAGVWVGEKQICAIGIAVRKMTSFHGIALNVSTDISYDRLINPCGLSDRGLTSLSHETSRLISLEEAKSALRTAIQDVFELKFRPHHDEIGAIAS